MTLSLANDSFERICFENIAKCHYSIAISLNTNPKMPHSSTKYKLICSVFIENLAYLLPL